MEQRVTFTKIVRDGDTAALYDRAFDDIRTESWGVLSMRPLVYISDYHDAIEKSLWCYLNNMVPLIGEKDPDLTARLATLYEIDSIIADLPSLKLLLSRFLPPPGQLTAISLIGSSFDATEYAPYRAYAKRFRLVYVDKNGSATAVQEL